MIKYIIDYLIRASLTNSDLYTIRDKETNHNHRALLVYSAISTFFFSFTCIAAFATRLPAMLEKAPIYAGFAMFSIVSLAIAFAVGKKNHTVVGILCHIFYPMLLCFGLFSSLVISCDEPSTSLLAMYVVSPLLFVMRPIHIVIITVIADFIFLYYCGSVKPAEIVGTEIVNCIVYSGIGMIVGIFNVRDKCQRMLFENRVSQFSTKDQLTHNLRSISDIYVSMHQINLDSDTFFSIRTNNFIDSSVDSFNENFSRQITLAMTATTAPEYLDRILDFVNTKTLPDRLRGKRTITQEFMGKNFGWCRARFIAIGPVNTEVKPSQVIYAVENISEQKKIETTLIAKAETDAMTGLLNRQAGIDKIKTAINEDRIGMLALFDVDKFKHINDNYGHQMGDEVIIAVANAMKETFREEDILLRLGGDEYIFFVSGVSNEEQGIQIISRFFESISRITFEKVNNLNISVSLGATFLNGEEGIDFEEYYRRIDNCTYRSKKIEGKAFTFWRDE